MIMTGHSVEFQPSIKEIIIEVIMVDLIAGIAIL
jgi:hypothetical protein